MAVYNAVTKTQGEKHVPTPEPGLIGFVGNDEIKAAYVDNANPETTGADIIAWTNKLYKDDPTAFKANVWAMEAVNPYSTPTDAQVAKYDVAQPGIPWKLLLRQFGSDLSKYYEAGVILDEAEYGKRSDEAKWAYLVDTDAGVFEAYEQANGPHQLGRFAKDPVNYIRHGIYPLYLKGSWNLRALPKADEFVMRMRSKSFVEPVPS